MKSRVKDERVPGKGPRPSRGSKGSAVSEKLAHGSCDSVTGLCREAGPAPLLRSLTQRCSPPEGLCRPRSWICLLPARSGPISQVLNYISHT